MGWFSFLLEEGHDFIMPEVVLVLVGVKARLLNSDLISAGIKTSIRGYNLIPAFSLGQILRLLLFITVVPSGHGEGELGRKLETCFYPQVEL